VPADFRKGKETQLVNDQQGGAMAVGEQEKKRKNGAANLPAGATADGGDGRQTGMSAPRGERWGPGNPHPLSKMKTELVWEGKYDEYGNRREVDVAGAAMPLQKIETIDEPRARAEAQGTLFDSQKAHLDDFRNMLVWGDNKLVMASLLKDFRGKIDLIYIDPPFDVGADFTMAVPIGDEKETVEKDNATVFL
jgi:hypothetical protein